jgi:hypothetical protein
MRPTIQQNTLMSYNTVTHVSVRKNHHQALFITTKIKKNISSFSKQSISEEVPDDGQCGPKRVEECFMLLKRSF